MTKNCSFCFENVTAKGITQQDTDFIVKWRSEPENIKYFFNSKPTDKTKHLDWFNSSYQADETRLDFLVSKDTIPYGTLTLSNINISDKSCEIGYLVGENTFKRQGLGVKGINALVEFARQELDIKNFTAEIHKNNIASQKTILKCGFLLFKESNDFLIYTKKYE